MRGKNIIEVLESISLEGINLSLPYFEQREDNIILINHIARNLQYTRDLKYRKDLRHSKGYYLYNYLQKVARKENLI